LNYGANIFELSAFPAIPQPGSIVHWTIALRWTTCRPKVGGAKTANIAWQKTGVQLKCPALLRVLG